MKANSSLRALDRADRPREKLARCGAAALDDAELLAAWLGTGCRGKDVLEVARDLLRRHPDGALAELPLAGLRRQAGIGFGRACALAAACELMRRWTGTRAAVRLDEPARVRDQLAFLAGQRKEHFIAFYLSADNGLLHRETVSIGTLTASLVHPREVFAPALERSAAAVLVAHNHPSGNPHPSGEDRAATRRLVQAGGILGIPLVDHVVVSEHRYYSFREHGLL
ncbi:MAG: DNA repair protein RadC [Elusimicrobiota bacterium]